MRAQSQDLTLSEHGIIPRQRIIIPVSSGKSSDLEIACFAARRAKGAAARRQQMRQHSLDTEITIFCDTLR